MAIKLKQMQGEEFVKKVLAGERDFSEIKLEEGFDLSGYKGFQTLQDYLKKQGDLIYNTIIIDNSEFKYIKAKGVYLPCIKGVGANLIGADLRLAYLEEADFGNANLGEADFRGADLGNAKLVETNLIRANLKDTYLKGANLKGANLREVKNLEDCVGLEFVNFNKTKITQKEKEIIDKIRNKESEFIIEE